MQFLLERRVLTLRNIFLYFAVVVLPVVIGFLALANMVEEQYLAGVETAKQQLDLQSARTRLFSSAEHQIQNFAAALINDLQIVGKSPQVIASFVDQIDSYYPDSCKWLFWDRNAHLLDVPSRHIMQGQRNWQYVMTRLMAENDLLADSEELLKDPEFEKRSFAAMNMLQKAMGDHKIEHVSWSLDKPMLLSWLGKPCYFIWNMEVESYRETNIPERIRGGFMLMLYPDRFPENFWLKRMIQRRTKPQSGLVNPVVAVNISDRSLVAQDPVIKDSLLWQRLVKAYFSRSQSTFEFENYLARASMANEKTPVRIISLADISDLQQTRANLIRRLSLISLLLLVLCSIVLPGIMRMHKLAMSLRMRITAIFAIAMLVPIVSLISIGRSFAHHEENRLKESALVRMRAGFEALEMRYRDAPRLVENTLYTDLKSRLRSPLSLDSIETAMASASAEGLFKHYVITDERGRFVRTNWKDISAALKKSLEMVASKLVEVDSKIGGPTSIVGAAVEEEVEQYMQLFGSAVDFTRPTNLNFFAFQNSHMYFMSIMLQLDGKVGNLFIQFPDHYLEKRFAYEEFTQNRMALDETDRQKLDMPMELCFYSIFKAEKSLPDDSPLWKKLKETFERSNRLKTEETGQVRIEDESYLYTIRPLSTMYSQSFTPCILVSTRPIVARVDSVKMIISALASAALLGAIILSLLLTSSLIGPISRIDIAAQQVGRGNLNVTLPNMGNDELGRLSETFNDMVRGLREREKMRAYVSESVLEAIRDQNEDSLRDGRRVEVSVLFSDIRNFTGLSEKNSPEHVFALLNEFFGGVEPIIRANHGRVDKFIGDAVMAVFHHSEPEHHTLSSVKAAFAIKAFADSLKNSRYVGKKGLEIGVGISTGSVLLGDVGSIRRKDLTVIGDEVNLASRLETASKKGRHSKIIVSGNTFKHIEHLVNAEQMSFTEIRGKEQSVQIYELISLKESAIA